MTSSVACALSTYSCPPCCGSTKHAQGALCKDLQDTHRPSPALDEHGFLWAGWRDVSWERCFNHQNRNPCRTISRGVR